MIETKSITENQKNIILDIEEDHFRDLKAIDIKPAKLTKTISAFANTVGGEIYIGIDETEVLGVKQRQWRGFPDVEAANGHLQIFEQLFPLGTDFNYTFLQMDEELGLVLQISILKTKQIVKASDGVPYIRRGAQSLPVDDDEKLKRLQLDKGVSSFESNTLNVPIEFVADSLVIYEFMIEVIPTTEPIPWLKKQLLISNNLPTVASVLLFADNPQAALPKQSGIKIYRYTTKDAEGTRETLAFTPISIEGCAYKQIYEAVSKVTEIIQAIKIYSADGEETTMHYPNETLHEIITNAVLHRDYSLASDIHIRIFDNRVEIESPGKLPGHVTTGNILKEQFARNGSLVRLINKFPNPPNQDVGEGLNTAFDAMKKMKLKEPEIIERENSVMVLIKHESLASPEEVIMTYLNTNATINNRTARGLANVGSENAMKQIFYALRDKGLIEQTPGTQGRGTTWRKK
ncbi:MAG: ATP-dependent DNA helicase RecG [Chlorobi bacterium]|nr:ATP-dependent DNA helicase RecG [Chlorobiota bacterium]MBZ0193653.1 putative DNA binding domain-containing protein [Candidatus Kapabacteria bacterium]NOG68717.1 ATP-dependent DNA helicase RecG [Chlorobiota bacterium]QOJ25880.1 MAG: putative DNA binding domain-containing protein [Ignavibacteria bacterium]